MLRRAFGHVVAQVIGCGEADIRLVRDEPGLVNGYFLANHQRDSNVIGCLFADNGSRIFFIYFGR